VSGVLDNIRVLDFGRYIAGPFCAALLGDVPGDEPQQARHDA
jgi:crotonobetainyl-CoA:carnitine CoA-transferase CaiB-like acyl-CoA transferase